MARPNVRERLLDAGVEIFHRCGFNGCGVQEITEAAGVPKGSFYNHFASKEALGAAVLDSYWQPRRCHPPHTSQRGSAAQRLCRHFARWPPIWHSVAITGAA
jgi:TetR/AcrR family transcriptional repressor of nem operon